MDAGRGGPFDKLRVSGGGGFVYNPGIPRPSQGRFQEAAWPLRLDRAHRTSP